MQAAPRLGFFVQEPDIPDNDVKRIRHQERREKKGHHVHGSLRGRQVEARL